MNENSDLVRHLRTLGPGSGYEQLMVSAADALERVVAERDEALARVARERVQHREDMTALERRLSPKPVHIY